MPNTANHPVAGESAPTTTDSTTVQNASGTSNATKAKATGADTMTTVEATLAPNVNASTNAKAQKPSILAIFWQGLWKNNPGLCQLLGMCPILAVTTSAANALGLGIATIVVLTISSFVISLLRKIIMPEVRIPLYVVLIASLVTIVRFEVEAYFPELYRQLGIYLALIATNCIIMGRAEAFAGRNNPLRATLDAIACGIGFTFVLFILGAVREILGNGTFFVGGADLLGAWAQDFEIHLFSGDYTMLIAILPPGGFFVLAFLIAAKNVLDSRQQRRTERKFRIKNINI